MVLNIFYYKKIDRKNRDFYQRMKRLFYFHGLQSKQGGQKIDYLTRAHLVHAPVMVYKQQSTWYKNAQKVSQIKPEIIVGSSMGGLLGFYCAYNINCKMLLFNPAFDRIPQYIDGWTCKNDQKAEIQIVLGKNDKDVNPYKTIDYLENNKIKANITWLQIEHRITYQVFVQQFEQFYQKIQN